MKKTSLLVVMALSVSVLFAQKKTTTSAIVGFDATTEKDALPKAENKASIALLDFKTGQVAFESVIKNFSFSNPKMQEHFNAKGWMDSDKYPMADFKGNIRNVSSVDIKKDGKYIVEVEGTLTIHGVSNPVKTNAEITVEGKKISSSSSFTIKLEDYNISAGPITAGKVSKEPSITVMAEFK